MAFMSPKLLSLSCFGEMEEKKIFFFDYCSVNFFESKSMKEQQNDIETKIMKSLNSEQS